MIAVHIVVMAGHASQTFRRIGHNDFRSRKALALLQFPDKVLRMNAHSHTDGIELGKLRLRQEIAGVYKVHTVDFTGILRGIRRKQCDKGMLLMGRFSPHGANTLFAVHQTSSLHLTLSRPGSVQRKNVILFIRAVQIQAGRHNFCHINRLPCRIFQNHTAGDHIFLFKCSIDQVCSQTDDRIRQM